MRIDYFSVGGEVLHLWPTGDEPTPRMAAETMRVFGDAANGKVVRAGGPPFGTELITVIAQDRRSSWAPALPWSGHPIICAI